MKKVSLYLMMLWLFFVWIFWFGNNLYSVYVSSEGTEDNVSCPDIYNPVCWVKKCPTCSSWQNCIMMECLESYKTFSNECVLWQNSQGYTYFSNWECWVSKNITVTAPSSVVKWTTLTYSWNAIGWYEYCMPTWVIVWDSSSSSWSEKLWITWTSRATAPTTSNSTTMVVGVQCYYKDLRWMYVSDTKTATITLTSNQCVQLWWAWPNWSLWPNDPNKDKKCCEWLTIVSPPKCNYIDPITWLKVVLDWCWSICAKVWDWVCDSKYENDQNSSDCKVTRNITLTAPSKVTNKSTFKLEWNAQWYYSCTPRWSWIKTTDWRNWIDMLSIPVKWNFTLDASTIYGYKSANTIELWVACKYYWNNNSVLTDYKNVIIQVEESTVCTMDYTPVCWQRVNEICPDCACIEWYKCDCWPCIKTYDYKIFSNKCVLWQNKEGYSFYKEWECKTEEKTYCWDWKVQSPNSGWVYEECDLWRSNWMWSCNTLCKVEKRNIMLDAPTSVEKWTTYTMMWETQWFEYCDLYWSVFSIWTWGVMNSKRVLFGWKITIPAPIVWSKISDWSLWVQCYYRGWDGSSWYKSEIKTQKIKYTDPSIECTMDYTPVCWQRVNEICPDCACIEWYKCDCWPCIKTYDYKIFSNKCVLWQNKEGYSFYKEWECKAEVKRNIEFIAPDSVNMWNNFSVSWKATNYDYCETVITYPQNYSSPNSSTSDTVSKKSISWELELKAPNYDNESSMKVWVRCYYYNSATNVTKSDFNSKKITLVKETEICSSVYAPVCWVNKQIIACSTCVCEVWEDCSCPPCIQKDPIYKTYSNSCELEKNKEGYIFHSDWECKQDKPCMSTWEPVCWVKYLEACSNWWTCKKIPVYKTFWDQCELKINTAKFVFHRSWKCEDIWENVIVLTSRMKIKLDRSLEKLFNSIDQNFTNSVDKIEYYQKILTKLNSTLNAKPKYVNIINYLVEKIKEEMTIIAESDDIDIDDLLKIFD